MGNFDMLPMEIMLEIFTRLPAETVLECKAVSKLWRNFVRHQSFPQLHLNHLDSADDSGKSSFIFCFIQKPDYNVTYSYSEYDENLNCFIGTTRINLRLHFKDYFIIGSCNGLIYLDVCNNIRFHYKPAYICNPITRECIVLPKVEGKDLLSGFGCNPFTNEYKVVSICGRMRDPNFGIAQVYTLGSGIGWRTVGKMDYNIKPCSKRGVFANGAIHWMCAERIIVSFDLVDEEFHKIPPPPGYLRAGILPSMAVLRRLGDLLCACYKYGDCWDIWFLKKKKFYQDVIWSKEFSHIKETPISLTKTGGLLCCDRDKNVHHYYPPKASSSRMLVNIGESEIFLFGFLHKNTLVSLKALGKEDTKPMDSAESARSSRETESSDHRQQKRRKKRISKFA